MAVFIVHHKHQNHFISSLPLGVYIKRSPFHRGCCQLLTPPLWSTPRYTPRCRESDHLVVVYSDYPLPLHSDWERVSLFVFSCRSVSLETTVLAHRTARADHTITRSLAQLVDRSFALRRNDSFAMITNHSRYGSLVVSQLRFSGPVPLNADASVGQPTRLPLRASLLMQS